MKTLDVTDIVQIVQFVQNQKGKYAKQTLMSIETDRKLDPALRKIVLDNFNSYARAICKGFGYNIEE